nr:T9SS type A sorting domain-containing protein [Chitinophagales bacterium]
QTFLTWKNPSVSNLQYNVYRSASPLSSASDLNTATFLGFVRDNSAKNVRKSTLQGQSFYFTINPANGPLANDRGLYVVTCINVGSYYYAVTVVTLINNQEDKSVINNSNSLNSPISEFVANPKPILQYQSVNTDGKLRYEYAQWGNNQDAPHYPAFNNAGSYGYNFTLFKAGNSTNGPIYVIYNDEDPFSTTLTNNLNNCNILKLDDYLPNGITTNWSGWNENYDMYATNNPVAVTGVVRMYTQCRVKETIEWTRKYISADSNKVYLTGVSHNGFGALLTAQMYPNMVAAVYAKVAPILYKAMANTEREQQWCKTTLNLPSDYPDPNTGAAIPIWYLLDMRHMYIANSNRGIPYIGGVHGKQDFTIGWVQSKFWYDSVNVSKQGGAWYWDQRNHDNDGAKFLDTEVTPEYERFTLARSFPAFSNCSINQNPGNGANNSGDAWGAINGYLDWNDASIIDNNFNYSITCFVKDLYAGGVPAPSQYDSCTTSITLRRVQHFTPTIGQTVYWTVKNNNGITVQQGTTTYTGAPITLNGIKIYRSSSTITMTIEDCSIWNVPTPTISSNGPTTYCLENPSTLSTISGYSYQWKKGDIAITGATNQTYSPTSSSTSYKVLISDVHGCTKLSDNFAVTVNTPSTPVVTAPDGTTICQGETTTLTANTGYSSYQWSSGQSTLSIPVLTSGNYSVTVTDANGCSANSAAKTIIVNPSPQPSITASGPISFCDGGAVTLDAGSGYNSYSWSNVKNTQSITVTASGTFTVTVTNTYGCAGTSVPLTVDEWILPTPVVTTSIGTTTFCANTGVYLTTLSGYSYQWQKSNVNISGATAQNYTPTATGSYKVIITDSHGCSKSSIALSITIKTNPAPVITGPSVVCQGSSVTLSSGTYPSYAWSTGANTPTVSVNGAGNYSVTVADSYGCSGTSPIKTITLSPLPLPVITSQGSTQFCDGGSVTLDAGNGYSSYSWSNGKNTQTNLITSSGTFTATVTNASGCSGTSAPVVVDEWIPPTPTVSTSTGATTFCANTGVYLTTSVSGYNYQWQKSNVNLAGATNQNYSPASTGSYKVIITDSHGCSKSSIALSITIKTNPAPVITGPSTVCQGSSVSLSCGSYSSYAWSTGANTATINTSSSGNYSVTVMDVSGCFGTSPVKTITLSPLPAPVITAQGSTQFCDGGSVTLDAGNGYSSYSWSNGKNTQTNLVTASGTFTVTVTNAGGCAATSAPTTVDEWIPPTPTVSTSTGITTFCINSGIYLTTPLNGYAYQWQKGTTNIAGATNKNFTPTSSGSYKVKITDTHGCSKTSTGLSITVYTAPTATISISGSGNICSGQTKIITANGGTGLTYQWKRDGNNIFGATSSTYTASIAGNYTCLITNMNGCSTTSNSIAITSNCKGDEANITSQKEVSWFIYPNPTSSDLHIRVNTGSVENGSYQVEIKNLLGITIWQNESTFTNSTIADDVIIDRSVPSGVYLVVVFMGEQVYYSQFILTKR